MVKKVVIPCAGWATRLLPLSKAVPKVLFPVVNKPVLQYGIEEALSSGIREIVLVSDKRFEPILRQYLLPDTALEAFLALKEEREQIELLGQVEQVLKQIKLTFVRQPFPRGLGDAILRAEDAVGQEPFAVLLPDDLILSRTPCLRQLLKVFCQVNSPVVALERMSPAEIEKSGVVKGKRIGPKVFLLEDMVEKPSISKAPSDLAIIGRYILSPDIFQALKRTKPGIKGEKQLTDGLRMLTTERPVYGYLYKGRRYDVGSKSGWLRANIELSLPSSAN